MGASAMLMARASLPITATQGYRVTKHALKQKLVNTIKGKNNREYAKNGH